MKQSKAWMKRRLFTGPPFLLWVTKANEHRYIDLIVIKDKV